MTLGVWIAMAAGAATPTSTGDTAWWNSTGDTSITTPPPETGQTGDTGGHDSGGSGDADTDADSDTDTDADADTDTGGQDPKGCACDVPPGTPAGLAVGILLGAAAIARRRTPEPSAP